MLHYASMPVITNQSFAFLSTASCAISTAQPTARSVERSDGRLSRQQTLSLDRETTPPMLQSRRMEQTRSLGVPIKGISHLQAEAAQEAETGRPARPELEARVVEGHLLVPREAEAARLAPARRTCALLLQKQLLTCEEADHLLLEEISKKQQMHQHSQKRRSSSFRRRLQLQIQSPRRLPSPWPMSQSFSQKIQTLG